MLILCVNLFEFVYFLLFVCYVHILPFVKIDKNIHILQVENLETSDKAVTFRRHKGNSKIYQEIIVEGKVDTVSKAFNFAVQKYGDRDCIGTREVLGEEDEVQSSGKVSEIKGKLPKTKTDDAI